MKVAIIGGSGKMGRWFARHLLAEGDEVVISGRTESKVMEARRELGVDTASSVEAVKDADVILLSVPIEAFEDIVVELAPHIQPEQVVVDVTSVKVMPVAAMHRHLKTRLVLGTHPLFGPGAKGITGQNFVLTPTNNEEEALAEKVRDYLETRGARVSLMTPEEHDDKMAVILGLSHFIAVVAADTLISSNKVAQPTALGGITYKVLLTLVESVISENPELYASIQMNLPGVAEIEALFQEKVAEWAEMVRKKDRGAFIRQMKTLKSRLEKNNPDFGKAYENMYRLASGL
ncbi:MAG: prephenate dehydrogenase [Dehalococcoidia bacterium]|nr:MAG: prephenate dehydrogenase [Dehalococcoidia bacterium]